MKMTLRLGLAAMLLAIAFGGGPLAVKAAPGDTSDLKAEFLRLCDGEAKVLYEQAIVEKPERPFYRDSYAVRGLAVAHQWMLDNMAGRSEADYLSQWGSKLGGLPFHLYVYAAQTSGNDKLTAAGDELLRHLGGILDRVSPSTQLAAFALMSYAERVSPGSIYRTSKQSVGGIRSETGGK